MRATKIAIVQRITYVRISPDVTDQDLLAAFCKRYNGLWATQRAM